MKHLESLRTDFRGICTVRRSATAPRHMPLLVTTDTLHKDLSTLTGNRVRTLSDNCLSSLPTDTSPRVLAVG